MPKKMMSIKVPGCLVAGVAIAATGITSPAFAGPDSPQLLAQAGQCRAANRSTPIFETASTISSALRLVAPNQQVTLAGSGADGFIRISSPVNGFIQTAVLKPCGTPPPERLGCRLLVAPDFVNVRREPKIPAAGTPDNVIGGVAKGQTVSVVLNTTGSVVSATADGYNWVQIDASKSPVFKSGLGWIYNSRVGFNESNLTLCQ